MDAFERLKEEAAKASVSHPPKALELPHPKLPDPALAKAALEVMAREGLPVKGTNAEGWEALRPKIVHDAKPNKVRGGREGMHLEEEWVRRFGLAGCLWHKLVG